MADALPRRDWAYCGTQTRRNASARMLTCHINIGPEYRVFGRADRVRYIVVFDVEETWRVDLGVHEVTTSV